MIRMVGGPFGGEGLERGFCFLIHGRRTVRSSSFDEDDWGLLWIYMR